MNIKKIWKNHKKAIVLTGVVIGGAVIGYLVIKSVAGKHTVDLTGKNVISWVPDNKVLTLEEVKEFLDVTANEPTMFAIFREGKNLKDYAIVLLNEVLPK